MTQISSGGYTSTIGIEDAAAWLEGASSVVITTHQKPDGDAVGSSLALARALRLRDPDLSVEVWFAGVLPDFLGTVGEGTPVRHLDKQPATDSDEPDAIVIVDTGSWNQLGALRTYLEPRAARTLILDHHLSGDAVITERRLIETTAAAAAQIVAPLCARLLGVAPSGLPVPVAEPLYLGVATDTGWFRFSNVTPATMRLGADLIEAGVDHTALFRMIELRDRPGRLRLFGRALDALELLDGDRIALMMLSKRDFAEAGAKPGDTGGFADRALAVESVMVSVVLTEAEDHDGTTVTKISMRSKDGPGAVDVNQAAGTLGGGGHARAAGARVAGSLAAARLKVLESLGIGTGA